ncbi:MAG: hypothetical protein R2941_09510 [Desulfobacterales bacterium]
MAHLTLNLPDSLLEHAKYFGQITTPGCSSGIDRCSENDVARMGSFGKL